MNEPDEFDNPSPEERERIIQWSQTKQRQGRPTCPCGFMGGARNIVQHRSACETWQFLARQHRWTLLAPTPSNPETHHQP